jgi:hypothetical protein
MALKTEIASHEVNRTVSNLLSLLESERVTERWNNIDNVARSGLQRIELFARQLRDQLAKSSDVDVSINALNTIQANLHNTWNELNAFASNGQPSHITNALANLDGAISHASWGFFKRSPHGSRAFGETIGTVERQARNSIAKISEDVRQISERVGQIALEAADNRAASKAASEAIESAKVEITQKISEFEEQFEQLQAAYNTNLEEKKKEIDQFFQTFINERGEEAGKFLERLQGLEDQARNIVQIIGNIGLTGNYKNRAESEERQANFWRWATILLFIVGVTLVIVNIILNFAGQIDLNLLLVRFGIAVSVALPAVYTARESARHRSNADTAKQTELELASLGPFLEKLAPEQQQEVTRTLAGTYFGQSISEHKIDAPIDINKLVETLASAIPSKQ